MLTPWEGGVPIMDSGMLYSTQSSDIALHYAIKPSIDRVLGKPARDLRFEWMFSIAYVFLVYVV
jgi:hypothetical protein